MPLVRAEVCAEEVADEDTLAVGRYGLDGALAQTSNAAGEQVLALAAY